MSGIIGVTTQFNRVELLGDQSQYTAQSAVSKSYVDSKKVEAVTIANEYTDTQLNSLVDEATLNTLRELSQAIADNPNFSSDILGAVSAEEQRSEEHSLNSSH